MNFAAPVELQPQDRSLRAKPQYRELKVLAAAAILALLAKPACAQDTIGNMTPEPSPKQKALDKAYKDTMDKLPNPKVTHDPWGNVRAATPSNDQKKKQPTRSN